MRLIPILLLAEGLSEDGVVKDSISIDFEKRPLSNWLKDASTE